MIAFRHRWDWIQSSRNAQLGLGKEKGKTWFGLEKYCRKKISQIINDYLYLPFFLLCSLPSIITFCDPCDPLSIFHISPIPYSFVQYYSDSFFPSVPYSSVHFFFFLTFCCLFLLDVFFRSFYSLIIFMFFHWVISPPLPPRPPPHSLWSVSWNVKI